MNIVDAVCEICRKPIRIASGAPARCQTCAGLSRKKTTVRRFFWKGTLIVTLSLVSLIMGSCGYIKVSSGTLAATPVVTEHSIQVPHQPYGVVEIWLAATTTYPRDLFNQAKRKIADAIDTSVQPNSDGMHITVSLLGTNSFAPTATILTITIPKVPADPNPPVLLSQPTPTGDPFTDKKAEQQVTDANAAALVHYQRILRENHAYLAMVQKAVRSQTDKLRSFTPPSLDAAQDLWGALGRSARRFQGVQGEKELLLATDFANSNWSQFTSDIYLPHVRVSVIYQYCTDQPNCETTTRFWDSVFRHAGAKSATFADPVQSSAMQTLW